MTKILTLQDADAIMVGAFAEAQKRQFLPLTVAVLDSGGHLIAVKRQDGSSWLRPKIAIAKASGCLAFGLDGAELAARAALAPVFMNAAAGVSPDGIVPVPGGLLIRDADDGIVGAVGISGDLSDNDAECAAAGIRHAGFFCRFTP